ncbi:DUF6443 domain-containing protein [Chitinophaga sp. CF418]|uniref:DUF6443 domain-containing protein n=1 Tax=Chitinophaga sp. CF418 TaxID=1855287 RepID=UPI00091533ED|nr:DUF6443 domain-containing protein [Chitinophaga sp. CF418]SHN25005.1 RHS repeat-associated core domain-containing protein [Chitinophaga sp. CF418]
MKNNISKWLACLLLAFLIIAQVSGQNIPKNSLKPAATPVATPGAYSITTTNYIRTWEPNMPSSDTAVIKSPSRTASEVRVTTDYVDGLGRPIQTVVKGISPTGKDLVTAFIYDLYGRQQFNYLPYTPKAGNTSDGKFKTDPFNAQKAFYQDTLINPAAAGENVYYNQIEYEFSPLNRVLKGYAEGNAWAKEGGNRPITSQQLVNMVADSVRQFMLAAGTLIPTSTGFYPAGQLYKTITTNEKGIKTIEFKNKEGQMVLTKKQLSNAPGTGHMGWICTYHVYGLDNNLAFVLTPKAVDIIKGSWTISTAIAHELCFIYRYDKRKRLIISKEPGADSTENVYDLRDRLVITRSGVLKGRGMAIVNYYDSLNRIAQKALFYTASSRIDMQAALDTAVNADPKNGIPFLTSGQLLPQEYTYYDNYNYTGKHNYSATDVSNSRSGSNPYPEGLPSTPSTLIKGRMTGKRLYVPAGEGFWLTNTYYYNDKGRLTQFIAENYSTGKDIMNHTYDFSGKILSIFERHTNPKSTLTPQSTLATMYHYNAAGNIDSVKKVLNENTAFQKTIALSAYNELGTLSSKRLEPNGGTELERLNLDYNIRGWIRGLNKSYVNTSGSTSNWFGQEICYDLGFDSSYYSGAISGVKWKGRSDGIARAYGYQYDPANRLVGAYFTQQNEGSSAWAQNLVDYSMSGLTYDINGNLLTIKQRGMNGITPVTIDSLKYGLLSNSNKLDFVTDKVNNLSSKLGDFKEITNNESTDYLYNPNGDVCKDLNKDIDSIYYDHNNLPAYIRVKNRGDIYFVYAGDGRKVAKVVIDTSQNVRILTTDYSGAFVYMQDTLRYINHEEGRIRAIYKTGRPIEYAFDYFIKDYLGNIRSVITSKKDTSVYAATMETAAAGVEETLFANISTTRTAKPTGYPIDNTTNPNNYVAKLNASSGQKIGPSLVLRVMAGTVVQFGSKAYYTSSSANTSGSTAASMTTAILQAFGTVGVIDGVHAGGGPGSPIVTSFNSGTYTDLLQQDPNQNQSAQPKAYLSYVAFDDMFNMIDENSGVKQVQGSANSLLTLSGQVTIKKTGFFYIYTSNESATDVYFDNIIVNHLDGPLLEENHYYPYGLSMAGISSRSLKGVGYPENKLKFSGKEYQDKEFSDGWNLELYDFGARMYDPQIGRWHVPDPLSSKFPSVSSYVYALNDPAFYVDPDGMDVVPIEGGSQYTGDDIKDILTQINNGKAAQVVQKAGNGPGPKGKGQSKQAFAPALLPFLSAGEVLTGGAVAGGLFKAPTSDDWLAALNDLKYSLGRLEYIPNGGRIGYLIDQLQEYYGSLSRPRSVPYADPVLAQKMYDELTGLLKKVLNKKGFVYKLVATKDGDYNVYAFGSNIPVDKVPLKKGEIWKYGESTSEDRYDDAYLRKEGVRLQKLANGTQVQIKAMEKFLLYGYYFQHGVLPPGNKIFR